MVTLNLTVVLIVVLVAVVVGALLAIYVLLSSSRTIQLIHEFEDTKQKIEELITMADRINERLKDIETDIEFIRIDIMTLKTQPLSIEPKISPVWTCNDNQTNL